MDIFLIRLNICGLLELFMFLSLWVNKQKPLPIIILWNRGEDIPTHFNCIYLLIIVYLDAIQGKFLNTNYIMYGYSFTR